MVNLLESCASAPPMALRSSSLSFLPSAVPMGSGKSTVFHRFHPPLAGVLEIGRPASLIVSRRPDVGRIRAMLHSYKYLGTDSNVKVDNLLEKAAIIDLVRMTCIEMVHHVLAALKHSDLAIQQTLTISPMAANKSIQSSKVVVRIGLESLPRTF